MITVQELINTLNNIKNKDLEVTVENIDYPDSPFEVKYVTINPNFVQIELVT